MLSFFKEMVKVLSIIWNCIKYQIGNGHKTLFWKDPWLMDAPLIYVFPDIYAHNSKKNGLGDNIVPSSLCFNLSLCAMKMAKLFGSQNLMDFLAMPYITGLLFSRDLRCWFVPSFWSAP